MTKRPDRLVFFFLTPSHKQTTNRLQCQCYSRVLDLLPLAIDPQDSISWVYVSSLPTTVDIMNPHVGQNHTTSLRLRSDDRLVTSI